MPAKPQFSSTYRTDDRGKKYFRVGNKRIPKASQFSDRIKPLDPGLGAALDLKTPVDRISTPMPPADAKKINYDGMLSNTERRMLLGLGALGTAYGAHQLYRTFFPKKVDREKVAARTMGFFNKIARTPNPTIDRETGKVMWPEYRPSMDSPYHRGYEQEYEAQVRTPPYYVSSLPREMAKGGIQGAAAGALINRLRGGSYQAGALTGGLAGAGLYGALYALGQRSAGRHVGRAARDARSALVEHYVEQTRRDPSRTIERSSRAEKPSQKTAAKEDKKDLEPHIDPRGGKVYWPRLETMEGGARARGYVDRYRGKANPFFYRHLMEGASGALKGGLAGSGMGILAAHLAGKDLIRGAKWGGGVGAAATGLGQMALYHHGRRTAAGEMSQQNRNVLRHMADHYSKHDTETSEAFRRAERDPAYWRVRA